MAVPRNIFFNSVIFLQNKKVFQMNKNISRKDKAMLLHPLCRIIVSLSENNNFRIALHNNAFPYYMV